MTEPEAVSVRDARLRLEVRIGVVRVFLGPGRGGGNNPLVVVRAALVGSGPLVVDTGDSKIAGELDLSNIPNSRVQFWGVPSVST